jgi:hypothetical protein
VFYKGIDCGSILFDLKVRDAWQTTFVANLRKQQVELASEHAILLTNAFPKGKKDVLVHGSVIVCTPACLAGMIEVLRNAMIRICIQGLSDRDRKAKVDQIYDYISSESYRLRSTEAASLTGELLGVDVQEAKQHQKVWQKRGGLLVRLKNTLSGIDADIASIIEDRTFSGSEKTAERVRLAGRAA